jgi:uncharacterized protein
MQPDDSLHFTLKIASRCNLDCSYCYVYRKGDDSWRRKPPIMSDEVVEQTIRRIREYCEQSSQRTIRIVFHGGEPCLAGTNRFARMCQMLRRGLEDRFRVKLTIQTNGVLLNTHWAAVFDEFDVAVGVSLDGPPSVNDAYRVDHRNRGTHDRVAQGVQALADAGVRVALLSVVQFNADPVLVHRHLLSFSPLSIHYLMPDYTHDTIHEVFARHGPTPCADYLIPIFDDWWNHGTMDVAVGPFVDIARAILGATSCVDFLGNRPFGFVFVETDGSIEGLDVLRICSNGLCSTGLNVFANRFSDLSMASAIHVASIFDGQPLPTACERCPERLTCAGGYLPHRYSRLRGFDNPSVWCADLLKIFEHLRKKLGVDRADTILRRQAIRELSEEARNASARNP